MKSLYLIRHAKSSWKDPKLLDHERPLNKRGKRDAPMMADKMAEIYTAPEILLTSGAKRAVSTGNHFVQAWNIDQNHNCIQKELYLCYVSELEKIILNQFDKYNSIAIVAHNPSLEYFLQVNCDFKRDKFPTCGFAKINYNKGNWELDAFHYPKLY